jgi:hypothetical protein
MHIFERRNPVVPFEERRPGAAPLDCAFVKPPHRTDHRMIMRVEYLFLELRMPGQVNLRDTLGGNGIQIIVGVEVVIPRGDVDIVDVQ